MENPHAEAHHKESPAECHIKGPVYMTVVTEISPLGN